MGSYSTGAEYNGAQYTGAQYNGTQYNGTQYNGAQYNGTPYGNGQPASTFSYGNGDYSYNLNGQAPMDRKGRPLKNRFGMKLTFSILSIVVSLLIMCGSFLVGAIPLVFSVVALVFACLQNKEFKAGNWRTFQNYARTSAVLLWVNLGVWVIYLILFIIGLTVVLSNWNEIMPDSSLPWDDDYENEYVTETEVEMWEDTETVITEEKPADGSFSGFNELEGERLPKVKGFNKFTLQGSEISLPMDMDDFYEAGFHLGDEDLEEYIEPGDSYGYAYYDANDSYLGTLFIYNTTSRKIHPQDGIAGGITIGGGDGVSLEMVGDLTFHSGKADAAAVLGADVTSLSEDGEYGYYSWYFKDGGYSTSIEMDFKGEELREVWIMNYEELEE